MICGRLSSKAGEGSFSMQVDGVQQSAKTGGRAYRFTVTNTMSFASLMHSLQPFASNGYDMKMDRFWNGVGEARGYHPVDMFISWYE